MKKFAYINHQNKGAAYVQALKHQGWQEAVSWRDADICLADSDVTPLRKERLQEMADTGIKIFIYPHSARPPFFYDFPGFIPLSNVTARFVTTETHLQVLERMGLFGKNHAVGWSFCPLSKFHAVSFPKRILFGPLHANGNHWLSDADRQMNQSAYERLILFQQQNPGVELTVRHIGPLKESGLYQVPHVRYVAGNPNQGYMEIDETDLVVSTETFAYLAIARGKPTLMMEEGRPARYGNGREDFGYVSNWNSYKDLVMYPFDILSGADMPELIQAVCVESDRLIQWKSRMIGQFFDPGRFVGIVESYL